VLSKLRPRQQKSDTGTSAIELAFLAPALLMATLLIVQAAVWFHARQVAQAAVEKGARETRAYQGTQARGTAATLAAFNTLEGPRVTKGGVNVTATVGATNAEVTLTTSSANVIPFWSWPISVKAGGPIEKFQPPAGP